MNKVYYYYKKVNDINNNNQIKRINTKLIKEKVEDEMLNN